MNRLDKKLQEMKDVAAVIKAAIDLSEATVRYATSRKNLVLMATTKVLGPVEKDVEQQHEHTEALAAWRKALKEFVKLRKLPDMEDMYINTLLISQEWLQ